MSLTTTKDNVWLSFFARQGREAEHKQVHQFHSWLSYIKEVSETDGPAAALAEVRDMLKDLELMYPEVFND